MRIFAGRAQAVGDLITTLPALAILKNKYPGCKITHPVARKSKQSIPFLMENEFVDDILLSDDDEGEFFTIDGVTYKQRRDKMPFDLQLNCNPNYDNDWHWFNKRRLVHQHCLMMGFSDNDFFSLQEKYKKPFLKRKNISNKFSEKVITFQTTAGYGKAPERSPSKEWWQKFFEQAKAELPDYKFIQVGHPNDYKIDGLEDIFNIDFYNQFDTILASDLYLGLENGISWINGAYGITPMVCLLTNAFPGHEVNPFAFEPEHILNKNLSIFARGGCNNIKHDEVFACIDYFLTK